MGSWAVTRPWPGGVGPVDLIDFDQSPSPTSTARSRRWAAPSAKPRSRPYGSALPTSIQAVRPPDRRICRARQLACLLTGRRARRADAVIDACDQMRANCPGRLGAGPGRALSAWALQAVSTAPAPGGNRRPRRVTHDPLLASLRKRLRNRQAPANAAPSAPVFSREPAAGRGRRPKLRGGRQSELYGYGSSVSVTATFRLSAAAELQPARIEGQAAGT